MVGSLSNPEVTALPPLPLPHPVAPPGGASGALVKTLTQRVIKALVSELNHADTKDYLKKNVIHPIIVLIYSELFPYILVLVAIWIIIFLCSGLTFMFFVMLHYRK